MLGSLRRLTDEGAGQLEDLDLVAVVPEPVADHTVAREHLVTLAQRAGLVEDGVDTATLEKTPLGEHKFQVG